uniref:Uncharacterized protein n=1 Tax=Anguilla anguilla TaxID=7936 RepID=A0A0E9TWW9_ANGAN
MYFKNDSYEVNKEVVFCFILSVKKTITNTFNIFLNHSQWYRAKQCNLDQLVQFTNTK